MVSKGFFLETMQDFCKWKSHDIYYDLELLSLAASLDPVAINIAFSACCQKLFASNYDGFHEKETIV